MGKINSLSFKSKVIKPFCIDKIGKTTKCKTNSTDTLQVNCVFVE